MQPSKTQRKVLVTYRITRHSNIISDYALLKVVLVTYRITRHSNRYWSFLKSFFVLVTYRITRHSNLARIKQRKG